MTKVSASVVKRHQLEHVGRLRVEPDPRRDAATDIEHDVDDQAEIAELLRLEAGGVPVSIGTKKAVRTHQPS